MSVIASAYFASTVCENSWRPVYSPLNKAKIDKWVQFERKILYHFHFCIIFIWDGNQLLKRIPYLGTETFRFEQTFFRKVLLSVLAKQTSGELFAIVNPFYTGRSFAFKAGGGQVYFVAFILFLMEILLANTVVCEVSDLGLHCCQ